MLDEYLRRNDVEQFLFEIKHNDRYFNKQKLADDYSMYQSNEVALYIFYDALFKYKLVVDDVYLFDEYLEQLEKLYRKLDDFENIRIGVHKLICRMLMIQNNIENLASDESRKQIIHIVYEKYILNGYFIHGFSSTYLNHLSYEFIPEEYENYYDRFQELNRIFEKYNVSSAISKDFHEKKIFYTDDLVLGCQYSIYSPMFFYQFLTNIEIFKNIQRDAYLKEDYASLIRPLKRFMMLNFFSEEDSSFVLDLVEEQWNLVHDKEKKIALMLIPRNRISAQEEDFLKDDQDIYEVVDRLLSSKYNNISSEMVFSQDDISYLLLDSYYEKEESLLSSEEDEYYQQKLEEVNKDFLNTFGSVSYLLLIGSILILCGVVFTIFAIFRG